MRTILPLAALPLIEIALFVLVGGWIGLWPTLALVVAAAAQAGPVPGGSDAVIEGEWTELADPPAGAPRRGWARPGAED